MRALDPESACRDSSKRSMWRVLEITLWLGGIGFLLAYGAARTWSSQQQQAGLEQFAASRVPGHQAEPVGPVAVLAALEPNRALWSAQRSRAYDAASPNGTVPMGVLRIPSIHLAVPIYEGTDESVLDRGAGRIVGTARLDEAGNIGIAAHRDGFFRGLKDIQVGDDLLLQTRSAERRYRVTRLLVTEPTDVSVIARTTTPVVTLVTCYPFYFVGSAPQRFIVRAEPIAP
jgi:sortase A